MEYHPNQPHGQAISTDPYFTLLAEIDESRSLVYL
jgi:hypothetical protein